MSSIRRRHNEAMVNSSKPDGDHSTQQLPRDCSRRSKSERSRLLAGCSESLLEKLLHLCPAVLQNLLRLDYQALIALQSANHNIQRLVRGSVTALSPMSLTARVKRCSLIIALIRVCQYLQSSVAGPWAGLSLQNWSALRSLSVNHNDLTETGAACFSNSSLPELGRLSLSFTTISDTAAAAIAKAGLPKLQDLDMNHTKLSVQGLETLSSGQWPLLRRLDISQQLCQRPSYCFDAHWEADKQHWPDPFMRSNWPLLQRLSAHNWTCIRLFTAPQECRWPRLEYLETSRMHSDTGASLAHLAEVHFSSDNASTAECPYGVRPECLDNLLSMHLPALQILAVQIDPHNSLTAAQLAVKQDWPQLHALDLNGSNLGLDSMLPLQKLDWPKLSKLDLSNCLIDEAAVQVLIACRWPKLCDLDLSWNQIDHHGVALMAQAHWPLLFRLQLCGNDLCLTSMQYLITADWPLLKALCLMECNLTPDGFRILTQGQWPLLESLDVRGNATLPIIDAVTVAQGALGTGACAVGRLMDNLLQDFAAYNGKLQVGNCQPSPCGFISMYRDLLQIKVSAV